jgi:galactoside O-acetyltransferase
MVKFERFAGCGVNCSIMPGVTLAEGSILGANSLLTKDTEPWTIYVGSPAKPIKMREKETIINNAKKLGYEF